MVSSNTGSGKTAAFVLPALQRVLAARGIHQKRRERNVVHGPRVLVLVPTRELAMQVAKAPATTAATCRPARGHRSSAACPTRPQLKALRGPLDILIATPGRLIDHLAAGKAVLANVEMLVLDEADRMLDMGFIDDITTSPPSLPARTRQTVMFSATFDGAVGRLAATCCATRSASTWPAHTDTHADIEQRLHWADDLATRTRCWTTC
jgi:superfamily II DNA/RNA helicase